MPTGSSSGTQDHTAFRDKDTAGPRGKVAVVEVLNTLDDSRRQIDQTRRFHGDQRATGLHHCDPAGHGHATDTAPQSGHLTGDIDLSHRQRSKPRSTPPANAASTSQSPTANLSHGSLEDSIMKTSLIRVFHAVWCAELRLCRLGAGVPLPPTIEQAQETLPF